MCMNVLTDRHLKLYILVSNQNKDFILVDTVINMPDNDERYPTDTNQDFIADKITEISNEVSTQEVRTTLMCLLFDI